jgi:hypothetical protein
MSVLGDLLGSLKSMSLLQLLLAFIACAAYQCAQGRLLGLRARRLAWAAALVASIGFTWESANWMLAVMLVTLAVAGLGLFTAAAWLISRLIRTERGHAAELTAGNAAQAAVPAEARPPLGIGPTASA